MLETSPQSMAALQPTFWSEEHLARISQSPVSERDWMESVASSPSNLLDWLTAWLPAHAPDGWCGRTSPAYSPATAAGPSLSFSPPLQADLFASPPEDGPASESFLAAQMPGASPTESLMLSISEFPSAAAVSSLSDILETGGVPQQYYLSGRACRGILRRAEKRGKELPGMLRQALEQVGEASAEPGKREVRIASSPATTRLATTAA